MKRHALSLTLMLAAGALLAADPKDDVTSAAKKLAASDGYTWTTKLEMAGRGGGPTEGKMQNGMAYVTYNFQDNTMVGIVKDGKGAIKADGEWKSLTEAASDDGGGGGGFNAVQFTARRLQNFKAPTEEALDAISKTQSLMLTNDMICGDLTEEGAKALAMAGRRGRPGGTPPAVKDAKGSVKFWVKDGMLTKYELKVSGTVERNGEDRPIGRTATTEFKDIGSTKITVPDEAKSKMSS